MHVVDEIAFVLATGVTNSDINLNLPFRTSLDGNIDYLEDTYYAAEPSLCR